MSDDKHVSERILLPDAIEFNFNDNLSWREKNR